MHEELQCTTQREIEEAHVREELQHVAQKEIEEKCEHKYL
jgi:hypothetical protein